MTWIWIIIGAVLSIYLLKEFSFPRLSDLKEILLMSEEEKLNFLENKGYSMLAGGGMNNDYWMKGGGGNVVYFPHELKNVEEHNQFAKKYEISTGMSIEKAESVKNYLTVNSSWLKGKLLLEKMKKSDFLLVNNPDFMKEGFNWMNIEEKVIGGKQYYESTSISGFYVYENNLYSDKQFGIIHTTNKNNKSARPSFTIYLRDKEN